MSENRYFTEEADAKIRARLKAFGTNIKEVLDEKDVPDSRKRFKGLSYSTLNNASNQSKGVPKAKMREYIALLNGVLGGLNLDFNTDTLMLPVPTDSPAISTWSKPYHWLAANRGRIFSAVFAIVAIGLGWCWLTTQSDLRQANTDLKQLSAILAEAQQTSQRSEKRLAECELYTGPRFQMYLNAQMGKENELGYIEMTMQRANARLCSNSDGVLPQLSLVNNDWYLLAPQDSHFVENEKLTRRINLSKRSPNDANIVLLGVENLPTRDLLSFFADLTLGDTQFLELDSVTTPLFLQRISDHRSVLNRCGLKLKDQKKQAFVKDLEYLSTSADRFRVDHHRARLDVAEVLMNFLSGGCSEWKPSQALHAAYLTAWSGRVHESVRLFENAIILAEADSTDLQMELRMHALQDLLNLEVWSPLQSKLAADCLTSSISNNHEIINGMTRLEVLAVAFRANASMKHWQADFSIEERAKAAKQILSQLTTLGSSWPIGNSSPPEPVLAFIGGFGGDAAHALAMNLINSADEDLIRCLSLVEQLAEQIPLARTDTLYRTHLNLGQLYFTMERDDFPKHFALTAEAARRDNQDAIALRIEMEAIQKQFSRKLRHVDSVGLRENSASELETWLEKYKEKLTELISMELAPSELLASVDSYSLMLTDAARLQIADKTVAWNATKQASKVALDCKALYDWRRTIARIHWLAPYVVSKTPFADEIRLRLLKDINSAFEQAIERKEENTEKMFFYDGFSCGSVLQTLVGAGGSKRSQDAEMLIEEYLANALRIDQDHFDRKFRVAILSLQEAYKRAPIEDGNYRESK